MNTSANIKGCPGSSAHAKLFYHLFKQKPDSRMVASGFSIKSDGNFGFNSGTYNKNGFRGISSAYHDDDRACSPKEQRLIEAAVRQWWTTGNRNYVPRSST